MIEIIQQKLDSYHVTNLVEEEQATKENMQEIALYGLWRAGFFEVAAFQGGTSLRILYDLPRFSEDTGHKFTSCRVRHFSRYTS